MADVTGFLEEAGVDFDVLEHAHTEWAADEAAALGVAPEEVAKTLVLAAPRRNVRAVVVLEAGSHQISVRLKAADLLRLTEAQVADITREEPEAG